MGSDKKEKVTKTVLVILLFAIITALIVLIHLRNWQDIQGFERHTWYRIKCFCLEHRWQLMIIDTIVAVVLMKHFSDKKN